jgi:hypothetical protein
MTVLIDHLISETHEITTPPTTMRAAVFHGLNDLRVEDVPKPHPGPGEALLRVTLTTICGTDVHILKGEYAAGADHRARSGRRHRGARAGRHRL